MQDSTRVIGTLKVSIILPVFNESAFVRLALDSLNEQTVPVELLVLVDERTSDGSAEIARFYTSLVITSPAGKLSAKQLGALEASGDIVVMADADCYYPPDFVEKVARHFEDANVVAVVGYIKDLTNQGELVDRKWLNALLFYTTKYARACVSAYRRDAFIQTGYNLNVDQFDFQTMVWEEEILFNWRIARLGRIVYDKEVYGIHYDRRGACQQCPYSNQQPICQFCQQITTKERF